MKGFLRFNLCVVSKGPLRAKGLLLVMCTEYSVLHLLTSTGLCGLTVSLWCKVQSLFLVRIFISMFMY